MQLAYEKHVDLPLDACVLEVGAREPKRSYMSIFAGVMEYRLANIVEYPFVDFMPGPYTLPYNDDYFDLVVSGQMLEHCNNPFKSIREMKRVLRPGGYMIHIVPSEGPHHDGWDCWRFKGNAWDAIAEDVGLEIVDQWIDKNSPKWGDNVFVGRKCISDS